MSSPDIIISELWRPEQGREKQIYAVLDAARDRDIYLEVMNFRGEHCCLYGEGTPAVLAKAAPHLIKLGSTDVFTNWLIKEGWGNSWGIFVESIATLGVLRDHLRRFLRVKTEAGEELLFRYYDPRVLRVYMPTCNTTEAEVLFGPIRSFIFEGEDPNDLIRYTLGHAGLAHESIDLSQGV